MKPVTSHHNYSSLVKSTKNYLLLLSGGIILFILIGMLQLLSYYSPSQPTISYAEIQRISRAIPPVPLIESVQIQPVQPTAITVTNQELPDKPVAPIAALPLANATDSAILTEAVITPAPELSVENSFLEMNDLKNDSLVKELTNTMEMQELHFKKNSSDLNDKKAMTRLNSSLQKCIDFPETWTKIVILGFTDNRGSKLANVNLGMKRAEMLKSVLIKKGIPAAKITIGSFGPELPIASNENEAGRSANRRVELNLLGTGS